MMQMAKTNFILYKDFKPTLELLTDEQAGKLIKSVFDYVEDRTEPNFEDGMLKLSFSMLKAQLERDLLKYKKRVEVNQENGAKGGRPKKEATKTQSDKKKPIAKKETQNNQMGLKKADSVSDSVSDSVNVSDKKEKTLLDIAIDDFKDFRKKKKKPMTDRAITLLLNKLSTFTNDDSIKIKILEQSIMNGWTSIYEIKENKQNDFKPEFIKPVMESFDNPTLSKEDKCYTKHYKLYAEMNNLNEWQSLIGKEQIVVEYLKDNNAYNL